VRLDVLFETNSATLTSASYPEQNINRNRLRPEGLGESRPVADNTSAEGSALNPTRRAASPGR
jgi:flagellar motor protein MotB